MPSGRRAEPHALRSVARSLAASLQVPLLWPYTQHKPRDLRTLEEAVAAANFSRCYLLRLLLLLLLHHHQQQPQQLLLLLQFLPLADAEDSPAARRRRRGIVCCSICSESIPLGCLHRLAVAAGVYTPLLLLLLLLHLLQQQDHRLYSPELPTAAAACCNAVYTPGKDAGEHLAAAAVCCKGDRPPLALHAAAALLPAVAQRPVGWG